MKKIFLLLVGLSFFAQNFAFSAPYNPNGRAGAIILSVGQSTVTTTATKILAAVTGSNQGGWSIRNMDSTNPIYIGVDNTDSSSTGFILKAGETISLTYQGDIWMVSTGGSVTVCWMANKY